METLTVPQLVNQALVLYIDAGSYASDSLDKLAEFDRKELEFEAKDAAGIPDDMAMPEGMSLQEMSMGTVPRA